MIIGRTDFFYSVLRTYSGNDREQDLRAYERKNLRMYQETNFFAFVIHVYVKLKNIFSVYNQ